MSCIRDGGDGNKVLVVVHNCDVVVHRNDVVAHNDDVVVRSTFYLKLYNCFNYIYLIKNYFQ